MANSMNFVGLDVHANQTCLVSLDQASGELRKSRFRTPPLGVLGHLQALTPMRAVYESGPTGLGLARQAAERGLDAIFPFWPGKAACAGTASTHSANNDPAISVRMARPSKAPQQSN